MSSRSLRILVLSDLHSNIPAYNAVRDEVNELYGKNIDYVICLGDIVGYGPYANEMIKIAETFDVCVIGNHDVACATGNAQGSWSTPSAVLRAGDILAPGSVPRGYTGAGLRRQVPHLLE